MPSASINHLSAFRYRHVLAGCDDLSIPNYQCAALHNPHWATRPKRRVLERHHLRLLRRLRPPKIPQRIVHRVQCLPLRLSLVALSVSLSLHLSFRFAPLRLPLGSLRSLLFFLPQLLGRKLRRSRAAESLAGTIRPNDGPEQSELVVLTAHNCCRSSCRSFFSKCFAFKTKAKLRVAQCNLA